MLTVSPSLSPRSVSRAWRSLGFFFDEATDEDTATSSGAEGVFMDGIVVVEVFSEVFLEVFLEGVFVNFFFALTGLGRSQAMQYRSDSWFVSVQAAQSHDITCNTRRTKRARWER